MQPKERPKFRINFLASLARLGHIIAGAAARVASMRVCAKCVRPNEEFEPTTFGDFSLCDRCQRSVTSEDRAFFVSREIK